MMTMDIAHPDVEDFINAKQLLSAGKFLLLDVFQWCHAQLFDTSFAEGFIGHAEGFGDGDSFGLLVMEGDQVNNLSMAKPPHEKQMRTDYSSITLNFEGWLIAAER